jgi:exopolysaccharide production protein ExoZ
MATHVHKPETLWSIQVMRGFAAVAVVAYHTSWILGQARYGGITAFSSVADYGWIGVNFFFVLSGFVITLAHKKDIGSRRLAHYIWRRFSRVYPVYWVFLFLFMGAALAGFGPVNFSTDPDNLLKAATLIKWGAFPTLPLKVAWTLISEVFFYAMFALLIASRRLGTIAFILWFFAILYNSIILNEHDLGWASMWNINFFLGGAACFILPRINVRLGIPVLLSGISLLAVLLAEGLVEIAPNLQQEFPFLLFLLGLPFSLVLLGGALAERHHAVRFPKWLLILGEASFAIYLAHSAVISAMGQLSHHFIPGRLPQPVLWLIVFLTAIALGTLAHFIIERPLLRWVRTFSNKRGRLLPNEMVQ